MSDSALQKLISGDVVAIPTETVYGLAADITQPQAIQKIFAVKERPFFDPLIVHVAATDWVPQVAREFPDLARRLAEKFWPGPLTMILPKRPEINPMITSGLDTVGVRCPNHPLALDLLKRLGQPLAAPSANKFGRTSPTSAEHVKKEFGDKVFVLDGGTCQIGIESTVIAFSEDYKKIYIVRPGAITANDLQSFASVEMKANAAAPGQLEHHYQPALTLIIFDNKKNLTVNEYQALQQQLKLPILYPSWVNLPVTDGPQLVARRLYSELRNASEKPGANTLLLHYSFHNESDDLWSAIDDRLRKAATLIIEK